MDQEYVDTRGPTFSQLFTLEVFTGTSLKWLYENDIKNIYMCARVCCKKNHLI